MAGAGSLAAAEHLCPAAAAELPFVEAGGWKASRAVALFCVPFLLLRSARAAKLTCAGCLCSVFASDAESTEGLTGSEYMVFSPLLGFCSLRWQIC